eukprot:SAG31_NODE_199_length_20573_cov_5.832129_4_plen_76_part_00
MLNALPLGERVMNCELRTLILAWDQQDFRAAACGTHSLDNGMALPCKLVEAKPRVAPDKAKLQQELEIRGVVTKR